MALNFSLRNNLQRRPFGPGSSYVHFLALFLVVVGARLTLVSIYGSPLPFYDQWDGEAAYTFKPWMEGTLRISDLFHPHNEHRLVASRLLALGLLWLNGQWDSLLELAANALICGVFAIAVSASLIQLLGQRHRIAVVTATNSWSGNAFTAITSGNEIILVRRTAGGGAAWSRPTAIYAKDASTSGSTWRSWAATCTARPSGSSASAASVSSWPSPARGRPRSSACRYPRCRSARRKA